jgi:hypothetical protein
MYMRLRSAFLLVSLLRMVHSNGQTRYHLDGSIQVSIVWISDSRMLLQICQGIKKIAPR